MRHQKNEMRDNVLFFVACSALQLCCNKLEGSIPMELGALKQLTVLALQHNQLSGEIPSSLGYLESISRLDLSYNKLNGSIPEEVGDLKQLTMLDVTTNSLSGPVPQGKSFLLGQKQITLPRLTVLSFISLKMLLNSPHYLRVSSSPDVPKVLCIRTWASFLCL